MAAERETVHATVSTLQTQNAVLRQLVIIHDRLSGLVLQGADVSAITSMMADLVGRRVLLLDALLQVLAMAVPRTQWVAPDTAEGFRWAPSQGYVRAVLATLARERRPLRVPPMSNFGVDASCVLAPVAVGEEILGYLAILAEGDSSAGEDLDLQIVQHAATVYALSMMRERMAAEVARQLKDELFDGLLLGRIQDEQIARERAMRLGFDPERRYRVLVIVAQPTTSDAVGMPETDAQRRRLLEMLADECLRHTPAALVTLRENELVLLVPESSDARDVARLALRHTGRLLPAWRATAGLGGTLTSASGIARSYAQARRALETSRRFGSQGDVVAFEDLGVYRLLFHVTDPDELRGFTDQVLGPLIAYDQRHGAELVRTLEVFLAHNGNLQATARELSLHVNSVTYRLQRVQAIADLDLEQSEARLLAQVALKILAGSAER
jgi:purine catabolism regulator